MIYSIWKNTESMQSGIFFFSLRFLRSSLFCGFFFRVLALVSSFSISGFGPDFSFRSILHPSSFRHYECEWLSFSMLYVSVMQSAFCLKSATKASVRHDPEHDILDSKLNGGCLLALFQLVIYTESLLLVYFHSYVDSMKRNRLSFCAGISVMLLLSCTLHVCLMLWFVNLCLVLHGLFCAFLE